MGKRTPQILAGIVAVCGIGATSAGIVLLACLLNWRFGVTAFGLTLVVIGISAYQALDEPRG